jgi:hypothetical protein
MYVEPSLHPQNETNIVMVYDLFDVLFYFDVSASILLRILASIFIKNNGLLFSFSGYVFIGLWNECNAGFIE